MNELKKLFLLRAFGYEYTSQPLKPCSFYADQNDLKNDLKKCRLCNASGCKDWVFKQEKVLFIQKHSFNQAKSKEFLASILKEIGLEDFTHEFIIKCERGVNESSLTLCEPFLMSSLNLYKPSLIVCLGSDAAKVFNIQDTSNAKLFTYKDMQIYTASSLQDMNSKKIKEEFLKTLSNLQGLI